MKKTVWLLDADMTLFDFEKAERFALREACARFGIEISVKESALYHEINEALWRKLERGETTQAALQIQRFETCADALGLSADPHALAEAFVVQLGEGCFLFEQALSLLQNLHARCRVAIVTNGITQVQKRRLQLSGLSPYVDALVVSPEEGVSKPDPRIFEIALDGTAPERALMIGDGIKSDVLGANRAGVDVCWFNAEGKTLPEGVHAQYEAHSPEEIPPIALQ